MSTFRYFTRISIGIGTVGGIYTYYGFHNKSQVKADSFSENSYEFPRKWDFNWDK